MSVLTERDPLVRFAGFTLERLAASGFEPFVDRTVREVRKAHRDGWRFLDVRVRRPSDGFGAKYAYVRRSSAHDGAFSRRTERDPEHWPLVTRYDLLDLGHEADPDDTETLTQLIDTAVRAR